MPAPSSINEAELRGDRLAAPLVVSGSRALAAPSSRPGFFAGLGSLLSGFGFVLTTPSVWPLALLPVLIAAFVGGGLGVLAVLFLPAKIEAWIGATSLAGQVGAVFAEVAATVVAVALSVIAGLGVAQPLAGPALNRIVRRVELDLGAPTWPQASFGTGVVRSLASMAVSMAFGAPILALLFAVNLFVPAAAVVTVPLKFLVVALLCAWDLCDYPLSQRGVPVRVRLAFAARHVDALVGFGLCIALISLIPGAILFVLPAGVAGAARLVARIERSEAARAAARAPKSLPSR